MGRLRSFRAFLQFLLFWDLLWNTFSLSFYELIIGFPLPIILALAFNEIRTGPFKKMVQTVTYAPHFISVVVMAGMIITFLSPSTGILVQFIKWMGFDAPNFLSDPAWFKTVYVLSGVWQSTGWGPLSIWSLSGVDPQQDEAAIVDGASRFKRLLHINLPAILPTITILLILNIGNILTIGFEKYCAAELPEYGVFRCHFNLCLPDRSGRRAQLLDSRWPVQLRDQRYFTGNSQPDCQTHQREQSMVERREVQWFPL